MTMKNSRGRCVKKSACAACKLSKQRCNKDCVFAPYFPSDKPQKFANIPKVFSARNVKRMLKVLKEEEREDAVSSMVYEADARVRDPIYGCAGEIQELKSNLAKLQEENLQLRNRIGGGGDGSDKGKADEKASPKSTMKNKLRVPDLNNFPPPEEDGDLVDSDLPLSSSSKIEG